MFFRKKSTAAPSGAEFSARELNHRALDATYFRSRLFPTEMPAGTRCLEALFDPHSEKWTVRQSESVHEPEQTIHIKNIASGQSYFEALTHVARFDATQPLVAVNAAEPDETAHKDYFRNAAHREGIVFTRDNVPRLLDGGHVAGAGEFAGDELALVKNMMDADESIVSRRADLESRLAQPALAPLFTAALSRETITPKDAADRLADMLVLQARISYASSCFKNAGGADWVKKWDNRSPGLYGSCYFQFRRAVDSCLSGAEILKNPDMKPLLKEVAFNTQILLVMYLAQTARNEKAWVIAPDQDMALREKNIASSLADPHLDWFGHEYSVLSAMVEDRKKDGKDYESCLLSVMEECSESGFLAILEKFRDQVEALGEKVESYKQRRALLPASAALKAIPG